MGLTSWLLGDPRLDARCSGAFLPLAEAGKVFDVFMVALPHVRLAQTIWQQTGTCRGMSAVQEKVLEWGLGPSSESSPSRAGGGAWASPAQLLPRDVGSGLLQLGQSNYCMCFFGQAFLRAAPVQSQDGLAPGPSVSPSLPLSRTASYVVGSLNQWLTVQALWTVLSCVLFLYTAHQQRVNLQSRHDDDDWMFKWDIFYLSFQRLQTSSRWHPVLGPTCRVYKVGGPYGLCEHQSITCPSQVKGCECPIFQAIDGELGVLILDRSELFIIRKLISYA